MPPPLSSTRVTTCWGDSMGRCKQIASLLPLLQLSALCHPDSRWALAAWHAAAARRSLTARTKATQLPMQMKAQLQRCCCFPSLLSNNVIFFSDNKWAVIVFLFFFFFRLLSMDVGSAAFESSRGMSTQEQERHTEREEP